MTDRRFLPSGSGSPTGLAARWRAQGGHDSAPEEVTSALNQVVADPVDACEAASQLVERGRDDDTDG